jgi:hypothetical protein
VDDLINFKVKGEKMPNTKQSGSNNSEKHEGAESKFCCGDSDEIAQMMRRYCGGEDETFNCGKMMQMQMMQKMCCGTPVKSDKQ